MVEAVDQITLMFNVISVGSMVTSRMIAIQKNVIIVESLVISQGIVMLRKRLRRTQIWLLKKRPMQATICVDGQHQH